MPEAILFDMDGVLLHSYDAWFALLRSAAAELGYPDVAPEAFAATWGQGADADQRMFFPGHAVAAIEAYYVTHFARHADAVALEPDVAEVLHGVAARGLGRAVVTNTPAALARQLLDGAGLTAEVVLGADQVPRPKPAPDLLHAACEQLDVATDAVWMVGDSRYDREAAAAAGVRFVGLRTEGDHRVETLSGLLELLAIE